MVDCSSYYKMSVNDCLPCPDEEDKLETVGDDDYHFCVPTVYGYSFVTKTWGHFVADQFTPIVWNKGAFEHLVLPEETKTLIKSLVDANHADADIIKDVITGKGGGCIVILHGRPGTGKTLTAEAVAEERQKPLMVISVGELGQSAPELEAKLTDILEISKIWEAVLLLDEADVFLEARSLHELHRNAMVGVFLRLLEYHQRVMFLTTNRVTTLDEAFKSRISIAIKYRDLDKAARRQVWENFLRLAKVAIVNGMANGVDECVATITTAELDKLASKKLNGR
jgi:SpoVK/Ycf46/Vps4 family AAA+-type ATPase